MRKIVLLCFFPFALSLLSIYLIAFDPQITQSIFGQLKKEPVFTPSPFITNFNDAPGYEKYFLSPELSDTIIYLLGSSELTAGGEAIPYNFINNKFSTKVQAIGHSGNQCFSIFSQLLANHQRLKNSRIVIILSPGWFEGKGSRGTSSDIFLEFNSEHFLKNILTDDENIDFQAYEGKRISELYSEFNSPSLPLRMLNFKGRANQSIFHKIAYSPLLYCDELLLEETYPEIVSEINKDRVVISDSVFINWDSLLMASKATVIANATNNSMGISNDYFSRYINNNKGRVGPVPEALNQELEDFKILMKLLKEKQVNVSFIISPLNALYFQNLREIESTIHIVQQEIKANGFTALNLFETESTKYEKALLTDVMHMSDYGWYKVDKFIIETYHLTK